MVLSMNQSLCPTSLDRTMGNWPVITTTHSYGKNRRKDKKQDSLTTLGVTGQEKETACPRDSICALCLRQIKKGELCLQSPKGRKLWRIHTDCAIAELTRAHVSNIRSAEKPGKKKKKRFTDPKTRVSNGDEVCSFCRNSVEAGEEYIWFHKKAYHAGNKTEFVESCWIRLKRTRQQLMNSRAAGRNY